MVKMKDVAELAGVSISSVSKYLNRPDELTEPYKSKVAEAVIKLNYIPNPVARNLRGMDSGTVALVVPDLSNLYYVEIYNSIRAALNKNKITTQLFTVEENQNDFLELTERIAAAPIDGVIFAFLDEDYIVEKITDLQNVLPIVLLSWNMDSPFDAVVLDIDAAVFDTTSHLIDQGHKDIAYVGGVPGSRISEEKERGFRRAMKTHGILVDDNKVINGNYTFKNGYMAAQTLLRAEEPPTGIVCANDVIAIGCCMYLAEHGYRIPQDIAVTGMDGIQLSNLYNPSITTAVQPIDEICREAVGFLLGRIENPRSKKKKCLFKTSLSVRRSTVANAPLYFND